MLWLLVWCYVFCTLGSQGAFEGSCGGSQVCWLNSANYRPNGNGVGFSLACIQKEGSPCAYVHCIVQDIVIANQADNVSERLFAFHLIKSEGCA